MEGRPVRRNMSIRRRASRSHYHRRGQRSLELPGQERNAIETRRAKGRLDSKLLTGFADACYVDWGLRALTLRYSPASVIAEFANFADHKRRT